jgi:hypothetical protein
MLKRFILWDFARGTWQYDVMVGIILLFIFLTPREWFRDQPRIPHASSIAMLPSESGSALFWIDPELLNDVAEPERVSATTRILRARSGDRRITVTRVEPVYDSEKELEGFMAFTQP